LQSFILFCSRQYDQVTYADIEQATRLRRGSIVYYFKTKQELFDAVVESMLLRQSAIFDVPMPEGDVLRNFIAGFILNNQRAHKSLASHGIDNLYLAYYIIGSNAFCYFNNFEKRLRQMRDVELSVWRQIVKRAVEKGEITFPTGPDVLARMFMNLYYGHAGAVVRSDNASDVPQLQTEMEALYDLVKAS
jgi:AcrR family transcriptional regulator